MGAVEDPNVLRRVSLFQGLGLAQLAQLNRLLHVASFSEGSEIIAPDQPGESVYVILEGTVKICMNQPDGSEAVLTFLGPGDTVGEMSVLESCGRSASVVTTEPARLLWMDRATFNSCLQRMSPLAYNLLRTLASRLRFANEQIQALATDDLSRRLARQILALADRYGCSARLGEVRIPLRLSSEDLAGLAGAPREQVEEVIADFRRCGFVSVEAGERLRVCAREELARRCQAA
jgi:CRP/FNR family transcriptional regulator, cyclic AMP receptor protein